MESPRAEPNPAPTGSVKNTLPFDSPLLSDQILPFQVPFVGGFA